LTEASRAETHGFRRRSKTAWAMITAVVAVGVSLVSVVFTLVPSLKPDPLDRISAAISVFAVDPNVTLGEWAPLAYPKSFRTVYQRTFGTTAPSPDQLAVLGDVIYVQTQVDGYKHRSVKLEWQVYDSAYDPSTMPEGGLINLFDGTIPAPKVLPLPIDAPSRSSIQLLFIPALGQIGGAPKTFVRISLVDPNDGQTLAITDTPTLTNGVPPQRSNPS
jgi:hypothetical protein